MLFKVFEKLKLLKVLDVFKLNKLIFMFDYIKSCIPGELKGFFAFNYYTHSYITCSSEECHLPKGNTTGFGNNTLSFDQCRKI